MSIRGTGNKPDEHDINKTSVSAEVLIPDNGLTPLTADPAIVALSENRNQWEAQTGFVAANVKYKPNNIGYIELIFEEGRAVDEMPKSIPNPVDKEGNPIELEYKIGQKGSFDQEENGPINGSVVQSFTNNWGTPTGIAIDRRNKKPVILTCGHVIRNDKTPFIDDTKSKILYKQKGKDQPVEIGKSKNLVLSSFCDAGIINVNTNLPFKLEGLTKLNKIREVSLADQFRTLVNIHTLREDPNNQGSKITVKGKILSIRETYGFDDHPSSDIRFYDLFMIGNPDGDNTKPLTAPGDSGSLITDENGDQLGIMVGAVKIGNDNFSFGIKLKDVFDILQLDPIDNEQTTIPFI